MSILFGYKSKVIKDGLYEIFEPTADARYILGKVFRRAFMRVREAAKVAAKQTSMHQQVTKNYRDNSRGAGGGGSRAEGSTSKKGLVP
jgi:hypothetical protein